ncbi:thiamine phosphate synthase [Alkaliflexus imshenetskii]|uniref:thiamine phosphate synthase n=1 Tax=Alkaliflexus imshenetskii TaxID=286730 RepID=UPI0004B6CB44|nr:thiamine phosphate synthase [Alkaliflexus imshenetskii]
MRNERYSPLMFVTPESPLPDLLLLIKAFLEGGGRWVQLRIKNSVQSDWVYAATQACALCHGFGATFIVNDNPYVALASGADGLHLGKYDMTVADARKIVGNEMIIGGTANTLDDMLALANVEVDYIGLGPFRFTSTKKNLSPIIGIEGYSHIMKAFRSRGSKIPVTAIGGILPEDVPDIVATGVDGVAVSGCLGTIFMAEENTARLFSLLSEVAVK